MNLMRNHCLHKVRSISAVGCLLALFSSTAVANLTFDNLTINWDDSGWYQVLSLPDYVSVCDGGDSCLVSPGDYLVINHSTGMRWEKVTVPNNGIVSDGMTSSLVEIDGNRISWPDDGWYQVQSAENYNTVCQGVRACDVDDGAYVVINHSTNIRYEPIVVPQIQTGTMPPVTASTRPLVTDGVISWEGDDWYQVLSVPTYESICEGGQSCLVTGGSYNVINLTTGERWYEVQVEFGEEGTNQDVDPIPTPAVFTIENYQTLTSEVIDVFRGAYIKQFVNAFDHTSLFLGGGVVVDLILAGTVFDCDNALGTVEIIEADDAIGYGQSFGYHYTDCRIDDATMAGEVRFNSYLSPGAGGTTSWFYYEFLDFLVTNADEEFSVTGTASQGGYSGGQSSRNTVQLDIDRYRSRELESTNPATPNISIDRHVYSYAFRPWKNFTVSPSPQRYIARESGSATMILPLSATGELSVRMEPELVFTDSAAFAATNAPELGQLIVEPLKDQSSITISADYTTPTTQTNTLVSGDEVFEMEDPWYLNPAWELNGFSE